MRYSDPQRACGPQAIVRQPCLHAQRGPRSGATPTAAQAKVKSDFCAQCPDGADKNNPNACSQFFTVTYNDAGNTSSPGVLVLISGDALAQQIDQKCTGGTQQQDAGSGFGCAASFEICAAFTFAYASNTPQACNNQGKSMRLPFSHE
jgi:hypothetical protein